MCDSVEIGCESVRWFCSLVSGSYAADLHGNIPAFFDMTDGKVRDVNILDEILPEVGAFYVMDRG